MGHHATLLKTLTHKPKGPKPQCPPPGAVSEEDAEAIKAAVEGMPEDFEVTPEMYEEAAEAEGIELNDEDLKVATEVFKAIDQDKRCPLQGRAPGCYHMA